MMQPSGDGILISSLLAINIALLGRIWKDTSQKMKSIGCELTTIKNNTSREIKLVRINFHNFTTSVFGLLKRLHPSSLDIIIEEMAEYYASRDRDREKENGEAKGASL